MPIKVPQAVIVSCNHLSQVTGNSEKEDGIKAG